MTYNRGHRLIERTRAGDVSTRYQHAKSNPSVVLVFDPDIAMDHSFRLIMDAGSGGRVFEFVVLDGVTATSGIRVTGTALVEGGEVDYESADAQTSLRATLRPVGSEWLRSDVA